MSQPNPTPGDIERGMAVLASALVALGCPQGQSVGMARMLDKRARQLSSAKGRSYEEAMAHLLDLMRQGWAAKERGC